MLNVRGFVIFAKSKAVDEDENILMIPLNGVAVILNYSP